MTTQEPLIEHELLSLINLLFILVSQSQYLRTTTVSMRRILAITLLPLLYFLQIKRPILCFLCKYVNGDLHVLPFLGGRSVNMRRLNAARLEVFV